MIYFPLALITSFSLVINKKVEKLKTSIFFVGLIALFYILTMPHAMENLIKVNLKRSNLGAFDASLEVNNIACLILKKNKFDINCAEKKSPITVNKINILWRGNEYYLKFKDKERKTHSVFIRAEHVFGLSQSDLFSQN